MEFKDIDWSDHKPKISKYFTLHEATWLPSWGIHHTPSVTEQKAIFAMAHKMDLIHDFIGKPISVSVWIRPNVVNCKGFDPKTIKIDDKDPKKEIKQKALDGLDYNLYIGGAPKSAHIKGSAVDWTVKGLTCDEVRKLLVPKLDEFKIRVEDLDHSSWTHSDALWVSGGHNYFKP